MITKGSNQRNKKRHTLVCLIIALLTITICLLLRKESDSLFRIFPSEKGFSGNGNAKFKLKQIHRHGVGSKHEWHQKLEVDADFVEQAGLLYERQVRINQKTYDEPLWTNHHEFATENPFAYEFDISDDLLDMKRMADRSPEFIEGYSEFALSSPEMAAKVQIDWIDEKVIVPNITDKKTEVSLALMSSNAYVRIPHTGDWRNISRPWNRSESGGFGWNDDGLRGHVFANEKDNIVIISIKGTSAQGLPGSGVDETTVNDKINDNLLFSCCCARVSYLWTTVCDCYTKSYTCDEACLEKELRKKDYYYSAALDIYKHVRKDYPNATIWATGHSLGGALASLLGRTYGLPTVSFEAPGELLAAKRLHLPFPPGLPSYLEGIWQVGHTADPIFMGTCNGASSSCSVAGYAMETSCHTGRVCVYDVVKDKGWHVNLLNHRIHTVIDDILNQYEEVATCVEPDPCIDCYNWKYIPEKGASSTKSSSMTKTTTHTSTGTPTSSCVARNWFGLCTRYE